MPADFSMHHYAGLWQMRSHLVMSIMYVQCSVSTMLLYHGYHGYQWLVFVTAFLSALASDVSIDYALAVVGVTQTSMGVYTVSNNVL